LRTIAQQVEENLSRFSASPPTANENKLKGVLAARNFVRGSVASQSGGGWWRLKHQGYEKQSFFMLRLTQVEASAKAAPIIIAG
jgi:hypothetical protein